MPAPSESDPSVHPPLTEVRRVVATALAEDLVPMGDITSALLPPDATATATFRAREAGFLAGRRCAEEAFAQIDADVVALWSLDDGARLEPGEVIGTVQGPLTSIVTAERTALDCLIHLSGVATAASRYVALAAGRCRILDTRKTLPGLRALEKAAVRAGGGHNHRGSLSEMVMLKDNHLTGLPIAEAVARAKERWPARTVEVECDHFGQVRTAVEAGADMVLLDNMTPSEVADVVVWVRQADPRCLIEVSGGIDLDTVSDYAAARPDFISVGAITHSAPALDIGLDIVPDT